MAHQAMTQRDHELFCKRIWEATAHAVKCVARERGWPCGAFDEIYAAGRRTAKESDNDFGRTAALGSAELLSTNGKELVQQKYEIEEDWDITTSFIDRMPGFSVRDVK